MLAFHEQHSDSNVAQGLAVPQLILKLWELSQMLSALFVMVSCKPALPDPDKKELKYSATVSTFSVL